MLHLDVCRRSVLQERRIVVRLSQLSCVLVRVRVVVELSVRYILLADVACCFVNNVRPLADSRGRACSFVASSVGSLLFLHSKFP